MANAESCTYWPAAWNTDNPSILYKDLLDKVGGDRPFTNLIYAHYRQDGVADAMDSQGYKRDKNGEHRVADVYKFFNVGDMLTEAGVSIQALSRMKGFTDSNRKYIDFDANNAYQKAMDFNNNSKGGKVAYVMQHGDKFNVLLENTDSKTFLHKPQLELEMQSWQAVDNAFGNNGIRLSEIADRFPETANPTRTKDFLYYLTSLSDVSSVQYLGKKDIEMILMMSKNSTKIQNLLNRGWGDTTQTAERAFDVLHSPANFAPDLVNFVTSALNEGRRMNDTLIKNVTDELKNRVEPFFKDVNAEYNLKDTIDELNEKYGFDEDVVVLHNREINKLSEAAAHSMITLKRQIDKLTREGKGNTAQAEDMKRTLLQISREREGKRYYAGLINFVGKSLQYATRINNELKNIPPTQTRLESISARADILAKAKNMVDSYGFILKALSNLDSLIVDERISDRDKATLQENAEKAFKILNGFEETMKTLREDTMIDTCTEVFGGDIVDGQAVATIVKSTNADCSLMDYLYSVGRQSNPLLAAMGTVIRDTQLERDNIVNRYSLLIRQANDRLFKSGVRDTRFMYVKDDYGVYRIASDIDFAQFYRDKAAEKRRLIEEGYRGIDLDSALDDWVEDHTEVDTRYSNVSRIPKRSEYTIEEDFQAGWTDAQKEYYNTVMKIKGQLEELLPTYAQNLYLPPQRRATWVDIVEKGIRGEMTFKQVVRNLLDRMMNPIKIREDDTEYGMLLDGSIAVEAQGSYDGRILRQIPTFYTRRLEDQNDLILDFSAALESLTHTAVNYDAMFKIKNIIDMMGDYIKSKDTIARKNGRTQTEVIQSGAIHIASVLKNFSTAANINDLVDGFVEKHFYGIEMKDTGTGWRILQSLINYTSLNNLAPNLKGAISNYLVGEHQMLIDALAGSIGKRFGREVQYSLSDYAAANAIMFGSKANIGTLMDHLTNNVDSLAGVLTEIFDPLQEIAQENGGRRFYSSPFRQMIGGFNAMGMYSIGEAAIHYVDMYASLLHEKVLDSNGKKISLYEAYKRAYKNSQSIDGNREVSLADFKQLDGREIDAEFIKSVKDRIRAVSQEHHGSMNKEDKGLIHRRMLGRALMNFRQWMVEHYSRRYRGRHWDASQHKFVEGYMNTTGKLLKSYLSDYIVFVKDANCHWEELDEDQKQNILKATSEVTLLACLYGLQAALGDPDDHKREYWYRMWIYQVKRLILDEEASMPWGIPNEGITLLDSPVASVKTFNGILYPFTGLLKGDLGKTIQSGRYEGWNKYGRNLLKNAPFYNQIDQLLHMDEEDYVFSVFK